MNLAVDVIQHAKHESARVLNRLVVDLRAQCVEEKVEHLLRPKGAEVLVELL